MFLVTKGILIFNSKKRSVHSGNFHNLLRHWATFTGCKLTVGVAPKDYAAAIAVMLQLPAETISRTDSRL